MSSSQNNENANPNTPKSRGAPIIHPDGEVAYMLTKRSRFESPAPGLNRLTTDTHSTPISTVDPRDKQVRMSKKYQQNGSPPPFPLGVGIMPGAGVMTPQAGI